MERLTKKFTDGSAYCEEIDDVGIKGVNYPTYVGKAVDKLAEYEDLEEQDLLLRLPVPIGTTVYKFEPLAKGTERYIKTTVTRYDVFDDSIWFTFANGLGRNIKDFGKFVFLTQEEAEQNINEMESD